jgi:cytochrome c peroxidase
MPASSLDGLIENVWTRCLVLPVLLGAALGQGGCRGERRDREPSPTSRALDVSSCEAPGPLRPLPSTRAGNEAEIRLGRLLFHDPRLSRDGTISCATCHPIERGGADGRNRSLGIGGAEGSVNTPTVLNSGFNVAQFWDGRARSLEEQIGGPVENPREMGSRWNEVVEKIAAEKSLRDLFEDVYGANVTEAGIRSAIAAYERALVTPRSPLDRYLCGDNAALGPEATEGYDLFRSLGCASCHQGVNVGGNMFQRLGVMKDYFADRGGVTPADYGRFNVTGRESDRFKFKVPSLRNVALTAPYFHDGSAATLEDAVRIMIRYQLGREVHENEVARLVALLRALTGNVPGELR